MPAVTVSDFLAALRRHRLLQPPQLDQLTRLKSRVTDPTHLSKEILRVGWLTSFQLDQIMNGRADDLVLGPYLLLDEVGQGGMGQVFRARHKKRGALVAVKLIRQDRVATPRVVRRFRREIRATARLVHPNIIRVYDAGHADGKHFMAMEFIDQGVDLARLVRRQGPLPVEQALDYLRQSSLGLQCAHEHGLVHRDIKPANLLVTPDRKIIKILDFGVSRLTDVPGSDAASSTLTREGEVVGTVDFMAPEQARESHKVDIRADLYSLGCTLYYLLTGRPPFTGETLAQKVAAHLFAEPLPLEVLRPGLPPGVGAVARRLMAKRPEDRFQTPGILAASLVPGAAPQEEWFSFACRFCKAHLRIKAVYAHLRGRCPECGRRLEAPRLLTFPPPAVRISDTTQDLKPLDEEWPEPAQLED
jgi:serine/threonine-protein kinase